MTTTGGDSFGFMQHMEQPNAITDRAPPSTAPLPPRRIAWQSTAIRLFILLLIGALVLFVAYEWDWWVSSAVIQNTDDAYLQADTTPLAAKVPGYVRTVPVDDFQTVRAGDLLVQLEDNDYRAELAQKQAEFQKRQDDAAKAAEKAGKEQASNAQLAEACANARGQVKQLAESQLVIYRYNANGEREVMDDDARAKERAKVNAWIRDNKCPEK